MNIVDKPFDQEDYASQLAKQIIGEQTKEFSDSFFVRKVWQFKNCEREQHSLVNKIEIWKNEKGILIAEVFFNSAGCKRMQSNFWGNQFHHDHSSRCCTMRITNKTDIYNFLNLFFRSHHLNEIAKAEKNKILSKL